MWTGAARPERLRAHEGRPEGQTTAPPSCDPRAGGVGTIALVVAGARWVAKAVCVVICVHMLRQAAATLRVDGLIRRAGRAAMGDGGLLVSGPATEQGPARLELLRLRRASLFSASLALAAAAAGLVLPRPFLLLTVVAAGWYLLLLPRLAGLRRRAGVPPADESGALRDLVGSLPVPRHWYVTGERAVAPLTVALACVGLVAGTLGAFVTVDGRAVTVGGTTVAVDSGVASTSTSLAPAAPPVPDGAEPSAAPLPRDGRPTCAEYDVVAADLRRGPAPEDVAADFEATWRRENWPTLGCVAGPP